MLTHANTHLPTLTTQYAHAYHSSSGGFGETFLRHLKPSDGELSFTPTNGSDPVATVDELAVLLTGGKMSSSHRSTIAAAYAKFLGKRQRTGDTAEEKRASALMEQKLALRRALKLFFMSSSFHSTNLDQSTGVIRRKSAPQVSRGRPFKALVVLFLHGGSDSFNMLVREHIMFGFSFG